MPFISTSAGGNGSGAPGPQGPAGPAGEDAVLPQDLDTTDSPAFNKITLTSNGAVDNITIGDDVILGDGNVANHLVIIGQQDDTAGGIILGTNETEVISTNGTDLSVTADNDIVLLPGSNYAYLNVIDPDHRLATMADVISGTQGEPGPQGEPGVDALWNFTGAYDGGASYAVGDIVTYDGQLWYRFNANGGNVGDTPSPGLWNLLAAKGADGTGASGGVVYLGNYISGNGYIANIAVVRGSDNNLYIAKSNGGLGDPVGNTAEWDIFSENTTGGSSVDIADFVFTDNYNDTGSSGISLPGDKAMTIESGADSDFFLTAGDDLFLKTLNDDIHLLSNDDIRFVANVANGGTEPSWRMDGGDGYLYGPGANSELKVIGLMGEATVPLFITSGDSVVLNGTNGEYLNDSSNPDSQIATVGDLSEDSGRAFQSVQWTPNFEATGLVFSGSGTTYPTYNSYYVKQGQLVSFWITIDLSTVTNFGTGQLKTALPFAPLAGTMNHFSGWVFVDETANPDLAGHIILNADHLANTTVLDLHYIKQQGGANSPVMEAMLKQNTPVVLTTNTNIYVNGTYIAAS